MCAFSYSTNCKEVNHDKSFINDSLQTFPGLILFFLPWIRLPFPDFLIVRQRIAIARAILKNAPILILDEATSALDSENEMLIQKSLKTVMHGKTTIAIAHRLSTLRNMDRIIVLDKGKIVESGTHAQLLRMNGAYRKLWNMQRLSYSNYCYSYYLRNRNSGDQDLRQSLSPLPLQSLLLAVPRRLRIFHWFSYRFHYIHY